VARDAGADGVQVTVDLRIVGVFKAAEISPEKKAGNHQDDQPEDQKHAETGIPQIETPSSQIVFRRRKRRVLCVLLIALFVALRRSLS
jgi:hypothetical protein